MEVVMLAVLLLSGALVSTSLAVKPPEYTEKSLCDLWAGAQCEVAKCGENSAERCTAESRRCRNQSRAIVPPERASKVSECAKALLKRKCADPMPTECSDVQEP
jgi:hypothetical protein